MILSTLNRNGNFYKGNLHTHTTISDGKKSPEEIVKIYKENGYSFISITDHNIYGIHSELNTNDFKIIPGIELETIYNWGPPMYSVHHILGIGNPDTVLYKHGHSFDRDTLFKTSPQDLIDELKANGNLVIYNHPHWSKVNFEDIVNLKGLNGMEIYNYGCDIENHTGRAEVFYDHFLGHSNYMWCYGTDDAHLSLPDALGGYITVKAPELSHNAIFEALINGSFYASAAAMGKKAPEIYDFYVEDGVAKFSCSPCRRINFITNGPYFSLQDFDNSKLTCAEYKLPDNIEFVRAVCVDEFGYTSFTQPILLGKIEK